MSSNRSFCQICTDELAFVDDVDRASLGPCPHPHEVAKAVSLATECKSNEHSEASWNGRVHTYLLDLALYNSTFNGKVGFLDWWIFDLARSIMVAYLVFSSKARIEPDPLLPTDYAGLPIESKMGDFAVYLDSDDTTHDALQQLAARDPFTTASSNHTCYPPFQKRPLAMSIETKLTGRDWDAARIQMSIWVTAQLSKLEQLVAQDGGGLPGLSFLSVIVTQGHEWYVLAATRSKRETVRSTLRNIVSNVSQCTSPLKKNTSRLNTECAQNIMRMRQAGLPDLFVVVAAKRDDLDQSLHCLVRPNKPLILRP